RRAWSHRAAPSVKGRACPLSFTQVLPYAARGLPQVFVDQSLVPFQNSHVDGVGKWQLLRQVHDADPFFRVPPEEGVEYPGPGVASGASFMKGSAIGHRDLETETEFVLAVSEQERG